MDRLNRLNQFVAIATMAVAVVAAQQAAAWAQAQGLAPWLPAAVALGVVALLSQVLRIALELLFDSWRQLRKIFLGRQYIEGTWLDLLKKGSRPIGYGFSRIEYAGSSVRFSGEDFALDGMAQGHYTADLVDFKWPQVRYKYTYQSSANPQLSSEGYGEAQMIERDGMPMHYVGYYFDLLDGERVSYEGWRVSDLALLAELESPALRQTAITRFFAPQLGRRS